MFLNCSTCFGRLTAHHQELKTVIAASGFTYVFGCRLPPRWLSHRSGNRQPKTYVKPEAAITVFELLMMGGESPETCWAIKKQWNNKFYYTVASCWFFLWILYLKHFKNSNWFYFIHKYNLDASRPTLAIGPSPVHDTATAVSCSGVKRPVCEAINSSLPPYAFMAWCLMKHKGNFVLPHLPHLPCKWNDTQVGLELAIRKPCGLCMQET